MKVTTSAYNRYVDEEVVKEKIKHLEKHSEGIFSPRFLQKLQNSEHKYKSLDISTMQKLADSWGMCLFSDSYIILEAICPLAANMHLAFHLLCAGIATNQLDTVEQCAEMFNQCLKSISEHSTKLDSNIFNKENIPYYYGVGDTIDGTLLKDNTFTALLREHISNFPGIDTLFPEIVDVISISASIVSGRVIYLDPSHNFVICYGRVVDNKAEIFIAKKDSQGIWSLDKDTSAPPLSISTLKQAKQAIARWRTQGKPFVYGQPTHEYAERLSNFLGLVKDKHNPGFVYVPEYKAQGFSRKC